MKNLRHLLQALCLTTAVWGSTAAQAQVATVTFDVVSLTSSGITGAGKLTTPSENVAPGGYAFLADDLLSFSMTLTGIPSHYGPSTTTFTRSDLDIDNAPWTIFVNQDGTVGLLGFFGRYKSNADGYGIDSFPSFGIALCDGPAGENECFPDFPTVDRLEMVVTSVPEAGTVATMLAGLMLLGVNARASRQLIWHPGRAATPSD